MEDIKNNKSFLHGFIIFLTSFLLGFYLSQNYDVFFNNTSDENKTVVENIKENLQDEFISKDLDLTTFWQVYNIIKDNYYSSDELKKDDLQYGISKGLTESLGDKYSEFMTPKDTKEFNDALSGDFEGIGAVVDKHDLGVMVDRVIKGSPALNNGVLKGDIIIEANGNKLEGIDLTKAVGFIKGPAGTEVILKILRPGEKDFLNKNIVRQKITIPSVDTKDIEEKDIGYISLNMFGENTSKEFQELLQKFDNDTYKGVIIDLRDNGGGYLQSSVEILSNFIEKDKVLVTTKYKDKELNTQYFSENIGGVFDKKIVVLINGNSASASEITAGALKDYNKAILVGEKSYGKGSVQEPFDLKDGSMLKLTIAKWYTPKDINIDHEGIVPDIEVLLKKEDYIPKEGQEKDFKPYDRQLEVAKEILKKYILLDNKNLLLQEYTKTNSGTLTGSGN